MARGRFAAPEAGVPGSPRRPRGPLLPNYEYRVHGTATSSPLQNAMHVLMLRDIVVRYAADLSADPFGTSTVTLRVLWKDDAWEHLPMWTTIMSRGPFAASYAASATEMLSQWLRDTQKQSSEPSHT